MAVAVAVAIAVAVAVAVLVAVAVAVVVVVVVVAVGGGTMTMIFLVFRVQTIMAPAVHPALRCTAHVASTVSSHSSGCGSASALHAKLDETSHMWNAFGGRSCSRYSPRLLGALTRFEACASWLLRVLSKFHCSTRLWNFLPTLKSCSLNRAVNCARCAQSSRPWRTCPAADIVLSPGLGSTSQSEVQIQFPACGFRLSCSAPATIPHRIEFGWGSPQSRIKVLGICSFRVCKASTAKHLCLAQGL